MEKKVTVRDLLDSFDGMSNIGQVPTDAYRALKIAQNLRVLRMEGNVLIARRREIMDKFKNVRPVHMPYGNTLYAPFPDGWGNENSDELIAQQTVMQKEFNLALLVFSAETIDIVLPGIVPEEDLPDGITGADVEKCWWLIEGF